MSIVVKNIFTSVVFYVGTLIIVATGVLIALALAHAPPVADRRTAAHIDQSFLETHPYMVLAIILLLVLSLAAVFSKERSVLVYILTLTGAFISPISIIMGAAFLLFPAG